MRAIPLTSLTLTLLSLLPVLADRTQKVQVRHTPGDSTVSFRNTDPSTLHPHASKDPQEAVWYDLNPDGSVYDRSIRANLMYPNDAGQLERIWIECHFDGQLDLNYKEDIAFVFTSGPKFLHPCGEQHGLRVVCDHPASACGEPYADHMPDKRPAGV